MESIPASIAYAAADKGRRFNVFRREPVSIDSRPIRILTADDHPLLLYGIATLVSAEPDMELVAQASTGQEAIEQFRLHQQDVTLMDLQMPGGLPIVYGAL